MFYEGINNIILRALSSNSWIGSYKISMGLLLKCFICVIKPVFVYGVLTSLDFLVALTRLGIGRVGGTKDYNPAGVIMYMVFGRSCEPQVIICCACLALRSS